jgi:putative NIF3 family GTP cyclohydrolase 1 type 2
MLARDIAQSIEALSPPVGGEEGFKYGDPAAEVSGVLVCWMATIAAIEQAVAEGCNLIVCHEDVYFPYAFMDAALEKHLTWRVNRERIGRFARHGLTVYRSHCTLDRRFIVDAFPVALGLGEPAIREGYYLIFDTPPTPVRALAAQARDRLGLDNVRVTGDLDGIVTRLGLPVGGVGLSLNVGFINALLDYGVDGLIAGEMDEYAMRYVVDAGVPMVETGHSASENPGLRRFCDELRAAHPGLRVAFHECDRPWRVV